MNPKQVYINKILQAFWLLCKKNQKNLEISLYKLEPIFNNVLIWIKWLIYLLMTCLIAYETLRNLIQIYITQTKHLEADFGLFTIIIIIHPYDTTTIFHKNFISYWLLLYSYHLSYKELWMKNIAYRFSLINSIIIHTIN